MPFRLHIDFLFEAATHIHRYASPAFDYFARYLAIGWLRQAFFSIFISPLASHITLKICQID